MQSKLTLGIIGGMGPSACIQFQQLLLDKSATLFNVPIDQNHIPTVTINDGQIPNRNDAIRSQDKQALSLIGDSIAAITKKLCLCEVDIIVCCCNTAHFFQSHIESAIQSYSNSNSRPTFVSMIDLTTGEHSRDWSYGVI